jgi:alpha-N-acetylglucosamine transferase
MFRGRRANFITIACVVVFSFFFLTFNYHRIPRPALSLPTRLRQQPKYAYATFLSSRPEPTDVIEKDPYVLATRVMGYQLLHHPVTKTRMNIPFLVITPPHVPDSIMKLLVSEGATVIQVENLVPETWKPAPGQARWIDQFTKLRLFELTDYDRILYMDNDMLVTKCLDPIFAEKEVLFESETKNLTEQTQPDEIPMPKRYSIAGAGDQEGPEGDRPKKIHAGSSLNGGFFIFKPDIELFDYYRSVLEFGNVGRFNAGMMEMGLLNYAHRSMGNMPWTPLEPGKWSSNWPSWRDFERGAATLHDKFWDPANVSWIDRRLVEMWWRVQGQMEGFWQSQGKEPVL